MNPPAEIDWALAVSFLALGLGLGVALVWRVVAMSRRAKGPASADATVQMRDLAGKRDALVRQLRELEDTASKRTPEQLARERYALELEAAGVLLALEKGGPPGGGRRGAVARPETPPESAAPPAAAHPSTDRAGLRGFVWGTLTASALLFLGIFVYQSATLRPTGGSVTGGPPMDDRGDRGTTAGAPAASLEDKGEEEAIKAALARDPNDIEAHLRLARLHLSRQEMMEVWKESKWVLERAPGNAQALAYQALVRLAMGQGDVALELLDQAITHDPDLVDGYIYKALVYLRLGRAPEAEAVIATASKRFPDQAPDLQRLLSELKTQQGAAADL
ncbi:MAG TPA: tetratricopeptide repeat protein, partial [Vicinamibacteria bacterium]